MEEKHVKLPSPVLSRVRPSVHFGDSTNICDLSDNDNDDDEDTAETFDGQETDKAKEESTNQIIYEENNNQIPNKKTSVNNNPVPIIKVRNISFEGPDLRIDKIF